MRGGGNPGPRAKETSPSHRRSATARALEIGRRWTPTIPSLWVPREHCYTTDTVVDFAVSGRVTASAIIGIASAPPSCR